VKHLFHILWSFDFDALRAKLESIVGFITFAVTSFSVIANLLPKYEKIAGDRSRATWKFVTKIVAFGAFNWRMHIPGMNWRIGAMKDEPKVNQNDNRT
jgi:hypothetical protein